MKSYEELQEAYDRLRAENESLKIAAEEIKTVYEKQKEINKNYVDEVYELQQEIDTLKEQMKDMRCCGNCQHEQTGCSTDAIKNNFCEYWVIK